MTAKHVGSRFFACEIFATLMHGPRTLEKLCEQVGMSQYAGIKWMRELRRSGVVRISGFAPKEGPGKRPRIFSLQTAPFALPDEVYVPQELS